MSKKCMLLRRKHPTFGALLEVEMSKRCMPMWREAHVEVKTYKAASEHFEELSCRKSVRRCGTKHGSNQHVESVAGAQDSVSCQE